MYVCEQPEMFCSGQEQKCIGAGLYFYVLLWFHVIFLLRLQLQTCSAKWTWSLNLPSVCSCTAQGRVGEKVEFIEVVYMNLPKHGHGHLNSFSMHLYYMVGKREFLLLSFEFSSTTLR